jgi:hypothetical protein
MLEGRFWESVSERALKTFCQSLLSFLTVGGFISTAGVPWAEALGAALMAALLSVLTSIASAGSGGDQGPSWGGIERIERVRGVNEERGDD